MSASVDSHKAAGAQGPKYRDVQSAEGLVTVARWFLANRRRPHTQGHEVDSVERCVADAVYNISFADRYSKSKLCRKLRSVVCDMATTANMQEREERAEEEDEAEWQRLETSFDLAIAALDPRLAAALALEPHDDVPVSTLDTKASCECSHSATAACEEPELAQAAPTASLPFVLALDSKRAQGSKRRATKELRESPPEKKRKVGKQEADGETEAPTLPATVFEQVGRWVAEHRCMPLASCDARTRGVLTPVDQQEQRIARYIEHIRCAPQFVDTPQRAAMESLIASATGVEAPDDLAIVAEWISCFCDIPQKQSAARLEESSVYREHYAWAVLEAVRKHGAFSGDRRLPELLQAVSTVEGLLLRSNRCLQVFGTSVEELRVRYDVPFGSLPLAKIVGLLRQKTVSTA